MDSVQLFRQLIEKSEANLERISGIDSRLITIEAQFPRVLQSLDSAVEELKRISALQNQSIGKWMVIWASAAIIINGASAIILIYQLLNWGIAR